MIKQRSDSPCDQGRSWGYDSRGIWVDHGCRADFALQTGRSYDDQDRGRYSGSNQTVTCSSEDGRRHYCDADTRRGVELVRQRSDSPCQQGSSWGYDARGIWVDRGCRADFALQGASLPDDRRRESYSGNSQVVTCESDDGRRHYCDADTRRGVLLSRQRSGSACEKGYSWGFDGRGIWVDHGCRADFQVNSAEQSTNFDRGYRGGSNGAGQTVTCSSEDGNRHYCDADIRRGVELIKQRSGSPCEQGRSWGYDARGIWVDRGCRADFQVH
jgi:hypothetical protein